MDPMNILFSVFSLGIITLWAARLAMRRGKSPYVWGGAALGLSVIPLLIPGLAGLQILGIIPVVILMINPPVSNKKKVTTANRFCPYCGALQAPIYNPDTHEHPSIEWTCTGCDHSVTEYSAPTVTSEPTPIDSTGDRSPIVAPADQESEQDLLLEPEESLTPTPSPTITPPRVTPQIFTARGKELLEQNKTTEAVDQFTKALALDKAFVEALTYRIQAYQTLGLNDLAAEDQASLASLS